MYLGPAYRCSSYGGGEDELDGDGEFYLSDGVSMDPYLYYDEKGKQITKQKYWKIMDEEN